MERSFRITIEGRSYVVAVEELTPPAAALPGSTLPLPALMPGSTAAMPALVPGATAGVAGLAAAAVAPVSAAAAAPLAAAAEPGDEVAPLGGVVQSVSVLVGAAVAPGDRLVSLEAMKMVTHVVARRSGTVTRIAVKPGDPVEAGQVLVSIA